MARSASKANVNYSELFQGDNESDTNSCQTDENDLTWFPDTADADSEREEAQNTNNASKDQGEDHDSISDETPRMLLNSEDVIPEVITQQRLPEEEGRVNQEETGNETQQTRSRKRTRNPSEWKATIRKRRREAGLDYTNINGKHLGERRSIEPLPNHKCRFGCTTKFNEEERKNINEHFWSLNDEKKSHFYSKFVEKNQKARCRTPVGERSRRKNSYTYYFEITNERMRVCKTFFLKTLNISEQRLYYFYKHSMTRGTGVPISPRKGKNQKKVIAEHRKEAVREHIRSFPRVESHYCRANTKKEYLETTLNLEKMYELYTAKTVNPVKKHMYRHIFNYEFNIEFHKPKKDLCDICEEQRLNLQPSDDDRTKYEHHEKGRNETKEERKADRDKFKDRSNTKECVLCFDLENVISLPRGNTSNFFYKRKLNCYNLTAHCSLDNKTYCALWHESIAGRAGNHIASALCVILGKVTTVHKDLENIVLWSDSCTPQNRNSVMTLALQNFIRNNPQIKEITQKFSEPGHSSIQEIDTAHSMIEKALGNSQIHSPVNLMRILNEYIRRKQKLVVIRMTPNDFLEFQQAGKSFQYSDIPFTKIKLLHLRSTEILHVGYKTSFTGPIIKKRLRTVTPGRRNALLASPPNIAANVVWPTIKIIAKPEPLSKAKYLDIKSMLKWMPLDDRKFFEALIQIGRK